MRTVLAILMLSSCAFLFAQIPAVAVRTPSGTAVSGIVTTATTMRSSGTVTVQASPNAATPAQPRKAIVGPNGEVIAVDGEGNPVEASKPQPSERFTKLKTLTFDRRPSAILKAWAPTEQPTIEPPTKIDEKPTVNQELKAFQQMVAQGDWAAVKKYIGTLPDEEAIAAYQQMLTMLTRPTNPQQMMQEESYFIGGRMMSIPNIQRFAEKNAFVLEDFLGLMRACPMATNEQATAGRAAIVGVPFIAALAPRGIEKQEIVLLTSVLREVIANGTLAEVIVDRFRAETNKSDALLSSRMAAKFLIDSGLASFAGEFLPSTDEAITANDYEGLNLLSRHFLSLQSKEEESGNLQKAWSAVQAVLAVSDGDVEQQKEALLRAVDLAPRISDELGKAWLEESFTQKPDRGMTILATVGGLVSRGITSKPFAPSERFNTLKLMKTAVEAALQAAPEKAELWQSTLTLLAMAWYREADFSRNYDRSSSGPRIRQDMYGNIFYGSYGDDDEDDYQYRMMMNNGNMPRPITVREVLLARPNDAWLASVDASIRPKLADVLARLHLKVSEETKAFPLIKELANAQREEARTLVLEFLRVWTRNHDPNANRNANRYSWFFYGFEQRAEGIPLTRSKQERNLEDLSKWIAEIRELPIRPIDDDVLVKAFTTCHSSAEVYRLEAIETVFGPLAKLQPRTLAGLTQQMRTNLATIWRDDRTQTNNKTNRKKKDLEAEVLRGYEVARSVVQAGLKQYPNHYALLAAEASLLHDEINYRQDLAKSSDFSKRREQAFALFREAAQAYAKVVNDLRPDEQNNDVYDFWFAASLGAVDLGMISEEKQPDLRQPALIKAAIEALPGEAAQKHMDRFANNLFTRMSGAKPHVKFRYLKSGFEIIGEHPQAVEAKKLFDYYKDLVKEIKLEVLVDGSTRVGHTRPFGIFVNINHTRDIERESGGFGKYLQNQNRMSYAYNYGRPTTDYRDRFELVAKEALKEHFDVISFTFQSDGVTSRSAKEYGWRFTPYAYILLKPRGPQVDKIPELRIDLDFLDTSGYVVLPINSGTIPIDARDPIGDPRPLENLTITQTLDERQADQGKLILEIKADALGLIPDLDQLTTNVPEEFEVVKVEDPGVAVKKFDDDQSANLILSERIWTLTLQGRTGLAELPKTFGFPTPKVATKEIFFQRYNDADLLNVEAVISLEKNYGSKSWTWLWVSVAFAVLGLVGLGLILKLMLRKSATTTEDSILPAKLTPFTVLGFLEKVLQNGSLTAGERAELEQDRQLLQEQFYSDQVPSEASPGLETILKKWERYSQRT